MCSIVTINAELLTYLNVMFLLLNYLHTLINVICYYSTTNTLGTSDSFFSFYVMTVIGGAFSVSSGRG